MSEAASTAESGAPRVAASKADTNESASTDRFEFRAIGTCRSVFANKRGVPRQGKLAPSTKGTIELFQNVSHVSLSGLEAFSHVWLVFVFSRNTNKAKVNEWLQQGDANGRTITFPGKIKPPLLLGKSTGIFSTRSPHRPNPIGLTLAAIEKVEPDARRLTVSGIDLCDETPILDIKPYVPGDIPFGYDLGPIEPFSLPHLRREVKFAPWVRTEDDMQWQIEMSAGAKQDMEDLIHGDKTSFYKSVEDLTEALVEVLQLDVRAVHQGRGITSPPDSSPAPISIDPIPPSLHQCVLDNLQFHFHVRQLPPLITVLSASAYDISVLPPT